MKTLLSLFDHSGNWSRPYAAAGWRVIRVDLDGPAPEHGVDAYQADVRNIDAAWLASAVPDGLFNGVLIADPCTEWSGSGARHWKAKDADGRTALAAKLVAHWLQLVAECETTAALMGEPFFWARENPVGRSNRIVPFLARRGPQLIPQPSGPPRRTLHPYFYGDPYTKATQLWGRFNPPACGPVVAPIMHTTTNGKRGSWMWKQLGGKSAKTKRLRSMTPEGFARAFYESNH